MYNVSAHHNVLYCNVLCCRNVHVHCTCTLCLYIRVWYCNVYMYHVCTYTSLYGVNYNCTIV